MSTSTLHRVAVTGLGAVTPVGNTALDTWSSLKAGHSGIGLITKFDTSDFRVKVAAEVKDFDARDYFGVADARRNDPFVHYALVAADEAVRDAGLDAEGAVDHERLGVYVGSGIGGIKTTTENTANLLAKGPGRVSPFMIPAMIANMASGQIAIRHKCYGPTLPVVTACATSTNTIGEAFRAIRFGYADAILAGGTEAAIVPLALAGFTNAKALTRNPDPKTACRPFDRNRDGFVMGEGAAILVLEDMDHALARGAHVYAEVMGYGNTCDAHHITSPDPTAAGISRAIRQAADEAGMNPAEGLYVNAHGTSTKLNDESETRGLKLALGEDAAHAAKVSSTKSMTGHMLGAAGAVEALACAMALQEKIVPPTVALTDPDPACDLDYTPQVAAHFDAHWALSTSLGFGGHNAAIVLRSMD
ncbi:MAG: beta-ketoacyl-ACP synthase II [Coriobacteriales bacterium]|nr:beta-ketoacyl-ACP synthase II [Coriobacteriales bacterium]